MRVESFLSKILLPGLVAHFEEAPWKRAQHDRQALFRVLSGAKSGGDDDHFRELHEKQRDAQIKLIRRNDQRPHSSGDKDGDHQGSVQEALVISPKSSLNILKVASMVSRGSVSRRVSSSISRR